MADVFQPFATPIDELEGEATAVQIVDGTDISKKATVTSGGALLVTGGGGGFETLDNQVANLLSDLGGIVAGFDGTNYQFLACNSSGRLQVDIVGGGGFEVLDGQLAVPASDLGGIFAGFDGTNYQFIKTDAAGELQVDILTLPSIPQLPAALVGGRLDVNIGNTPSVAQSGTWNIGTLASITNPVAVTGTFWQATQPVSVASLPLPTGASTLAEQQTQTTSLQLIDDLPKLELASITVAKGVGVMGSDGTVLRWLKVDANGNLVVATAPTADTFFKFGDVGTASKNEVPVRRTAYTEQITNAQRSIASSSANDSSAGTGARQVAITYFDQTGAGPYTETLTLNGTTGVNTVNSNICFIESMVVLSVGSTGSNVGILTLYSGINKGGVVIGTIAATDNRTFWAHHYVATGMTMKVTGISCSHNGTTVGSGAVFILKAKTIGVATAPEIQIADFVRLYGQSSTFSRIYNSPVKVVGPSRVIMYVTPESTSSITYRSAFDFYEA